MAASPELEMLRDSVRRLADNARPKHWSSQERTGRSNPALWSAIAESGWLLAGLSEEHGGFGLEGADVAVVMEELGRGLMVEPVLANLVGLQIVSRLAADDLRGELIDAVTQGRVRLALAYAEPGARFAWRTPMTQISHEGEAIVLEGRKHVVLGAGDADLLIVTARENDTLVALLVPAATEGVTAQSYPLVDGSGAADVQFDRVRLTAGAVIGSGDTVVEVVDHALDFAATAVCAEAVGAMTAAFEMTLDYVKQRVQFGEPIGRNQALQHRLVDLLRMIREAEILLQDAVSALAGDVTERALAVSAAKIHICAAARKVGQEAVQMHGAIGTTDEAQVSHYFRRLIALGPLFGDLDYHRARFAALDLHNRDSEAPKRVALAAAE